MNLGQFPESNLTAPEERQLIRKKDFENLILANMRSAVLYARACCGAGLEDDELVSLCYVALRDSAARYKIRKNGIRFFAFSKIRIRGQISREWKARYKNFAMLRPHQHGDLYTRSRYGSRYNPWDVHEDSDNAQDFMDWVLWKGGKTSEPETEKIDVSERWAQIQKFFQCLNDSERIVITLTYLKGLSFEEIRKIQGVTRQAIYNTHRRAIKKLKARLTHRKMDL